MSDAITDQAAPAQGRWWIGLFLVVLMLVGRERVVRPWTWFGTSSSKKKEGAA